MADEHSVRCEECFGQVLSYSGHGDGKCRDCAGLGERSGLATVLPGSDDCSNCGGSGICPGCSGEGTISIETTDDNWFDESPFVESSKSDPSTKKTVSDSLRNSNSRLGSSGGFGSDYSLGGSGSNSLMPLVFVLVFLIALGSIALLGRSTISEETAVEPVISTHKSSEWLQYREALTNHITANLLIPAHKLHGIKCTVSAVQTLSGEIIDAEIESCENGSEKIKALLVRSVLDASPLPTPESQKLFDRRVRFSFGY